MGHTGFDQPRSNFVKPLLSSCTGLVEPKKKGPQLPLLLWAVDYSKNKLDFTTSFGSWTWKTCGWSLQIPLEKTHNLETAGWMILVGTK